MLILILLVCFVGFVLKIEEEIISVHWCEQSRKSDGRDNARGGKETTKGSSKALEGGKEMEPSGNSDFNQ